MTIVFTNGQIVRLPGAAVAEWILVDDGVVAGIGTGETPRGDRTVDLEGAHVLPGFCDAHVHLPATGLYAAGLDLRGETSADAILRALEARHAEPGGVLFGGNFEDPNDRPLTRHDLDRVVGDRPALLARADMHSGIVSTALLQKLDLTDLEGVDRDADGEPTGYVREKAAGAAWRIFDQDLSDDEARAAIRAAAKKAYARGVTAVHEMFVVEWRDWTSLELFESAIATEPLRVETYVATDDVDRVVSQGRARIGGDYFLDGSFGSHTAWMSGGYLDPPPEGTPPSGIAYRDDAQLFDLFVAAQERGLQVGVHAIGDAAIEQAVATWERVADKVGHSAVVRLGHRIEHFECASDDHIARAASLGLRASVQPAFDRYWGGEEGLYAKRIGWERARTMNRFASMVNGGLIVGAGSDSTVTPLDPFLQVASLRTHHLSDEQMGRIESLRLHTTGAHALVHGPGLRGTLEVGAPADLVAVDRDPVGSEADDLAATEVLGTWIAGKRVWPEAGP